MKYFTPQLWIAFQGPRRNAAFKTWARRFEQYRKSLKIVLPVFPVGLDLNLGDWGYDELTFSNQKLFRHEILFASGATITIDFRDFSFRRRKPAKGYHKR